MATMLLKSSDGISACISLTAARSSGYFRATISDDHFDTDEPLLVPQVAYEELRRSCLFCENLSVLRDSIPFQTKTGWDTTKPTADGQTSSFSSSTNALPASGLTCALRRPLARTASETDLEKWWEVACVADLSFRGVVRMVKAADFLDIPELSSVVAVRLASMLRGKSPEELCQILSCTKWWSSKHGGASNIMKKPAASVATKRTPTSVLKRPASGKVAAKKKPAVSEATRKDMASVLKRPASEEPAAKTMRFSKEADTPESLPELELDQEFGDLPSDPRPDGDVWKEAAEAKLGEYSDYACRLAQCVLGFPRAPLHHLLGILKQVDGHVGNACDRLFKNLSDCNKGFDLAKVLQLGSRTSDGEIGDVDELMLAEVASFLPCADSVALHLVLFPDTRAKPGALLYEDLWFDPREEACIQDRGENASEQDVGTSHALNVSTLRLLLDLGADSNARRKKSVREYDDEGHFSTQYVITGLGWAVKHNHVTAIEVLVRDYGADAALGDGLFECAEGSPFTLMMRHVSMAMEGQCKPSARLAKALLEGGVKDREWWGGINGHECWSALETVRGMVQGASGLCAMRGSYMTMDEVGSFMATDKDEVDPEWKAIYKLMQQHWASGRKSSLPSWAVQA